MEANMAQRQTLSFGLNSKHTAFKARFIVICVICIALALSLTVFVPVATAAEKETPAGGMLLEQQKWQGDYDGMVKQRTIRALVSYSKTFYFLDRAQQRGLSYELLKQFEKFVNKKQNTKTLEIHVVFIPVSRDQLLPSLVSGLGDIAVANLTITPERQKQVDFSDPLINDAKEVLITGPAAPSITNTDDLAGKEIHVRKSSSYYESLVQLNRSFKKAGKPQMKLVIAPEVFEDEDLLEMVNAGVLPMMVIDDHKARFWIQIFDKIKVHPEITVRTGGRIAWAFRKKSPKLQAVVNEFVKQNKKGTLMGNMMIKRYLKNTKYVKNSTSKQEMEKFDAIIQIIKKYADRYEFDYLMIGALAYQESGLDNSKKSSVGAIGVMQVLPTTAADPNVGVAEIHKIENNIHAGTKYLRFIINRYYKDEPMDDLNKVLFAFASYNAGPAKVRSLRKKASGMGLDPNVWFNNVEIAAAKVVGRETVQYVSNIYKYYIAYQMVITQMEKKAKYLKKKTG